MAVTLRRTTNVSARIAVVAATVLTIVGAVWLVASGTIFAPDPIDFRAFYCAGQSILAGADPYRAEPLRTCEISLMHAAGLHPQAGVAVPAPLPGYALSWFVPLAMMPFPMASTLVSLVLVFAWVLTGVLVTRLTRTPYVCTFVALALSDGFFAVLYGQIAPLAVLALCASALAIERGKPILAAIFAAAAMIEPHVALPACIALAIYAPRARVPLAACATTLALLSSLTLGVPTNVEYLLHVLPAHALSEVAADGQYSLTSALWRLGASSYAAARLGDIWYGGMVIAGLLASIRLARRADAPELVILLPAALAVIGGPFVHITQIAVTVPALFAILRRFPRYRVASTMALLLLAVPWQELTAFGFGVMAVAASLTIIPIASVLWRIPTRNVVATSGAAVAACLFEWRFGASHASVAADPSRSIAAVGGGDRLAEATWQAFTATRSVRDDSWFLIVHAPTWFGLALLLGIVAAVASRERAAPLVTPGR